MDWNFIFDIIESISIIIAAIVAIIGINSWRKEAKWKRKYELAEEVLGLFYEAKEVIEYVRFPGSYIGEGNSRITFLNETSEDKDIRDRAYITIERLEKHKEIFYKLRTLKFRFLAIFHDEEKAKEPFEKLDYIKNELTYASNQLGTRYWDKSRIERIMRAPEQNQEFEFQQTDKLEKIIWEQKNEQDPISPELTIMICQIEDMCKKVLSK